MLLRRITKHVKDQNWFAVGIDFIIVVIGVFIGIQVANWNNARSDAQREQQVLVELLDDLRQDVLMLSASSDAAQLSIDAANTVLDRAGLEPLALVTLPVQNPMANTEISVASPEDEDANLSSDHWAHITMRYFPSQHDAALNSLIAAGEFSIITDRQIVRDLQRYRTFWATVMKSHDTTYRPHRDRTVFAGQKHGLSPFTKTDLDALVEIVRLDPEMQGVVRTTAEFAALHGDSLKRVELEAQGLIDRIEAKSEGLE